MTMGQTTDALAIPDKKMSRERRRLAQIIDRIGDKRMIVVGGKLVDRLDALQRADAAIPGVSHRMLRLMLRALERDVLVKRTTFLVRSLGVDYERTEMSRSLTEPLGLLARWTGARLKPIKAAQQFL